MALKNEEKDAIAELSVMEIIELVEAMEEKFGVSAAAAVASSPDNEPTQNSGIVKLLSQLKSIAKNKDIQLSQDNSTKLSKHQRLVLTNQFLILEKLYPDESDYYSRHRQAIQEGYELHYDWIYENLPEGISKAECQQILNILDMYRAIHFSSTKFEVDEISDHPWLEFRGFDGNEETSYMSYVRYFILDLGRYEELKYNQEFPNFNSHMPTIDKYNRMNSKWQEFEKAFELTQEQLISILES